MFAFQLFLFRSEHSCKFRIVIMTRDNSIFSFCRSRWYATKKRKLKAITHDIRKLKRERAIIRNEIEINKETLQSLNAMKQAQIG